MTADDHQIERQALRTGPEPVDYSVKGRESGIPADPVHHPTDEADREDQQPNSEDKRDDADSQLQ